MFPNMMQFLLVFILFFIVLFIGSLFSVLSICLIAITLSPISSFVNFLSLSFLLPSLHFPSNQSITNKEFQTM